MKNKMRMTYFPTLGAIAILYCLSNARAQDGIDRPGMNLDGAITLTSSDPALCEKACNQNAQCLAYTYVKPNTIQGPNAKCWLKSGVPPATVNDACVSGTKRNAFYRFWNQKDHFYTTRCEEAASPALCNGGYSYEGIAGYVSPIQIENTVALYRMFNDATGDHFYTTKAAEAESAKPAYHMEGAAGTEGYLSTVEIKGVTTPLYRMFNPAAGDHFYTTDEGEKTAALAKGWNDEGRIGYVWTTGNNPCPPPPDTTPQILSFSSYILGADRARLQWRATCTSSCRLKIDHLYYSAPHSDDSCTSSGHMDVDRERTVANTPGQFTLTVQCCGNHTVTSTTDVPNWTGQGNQCSGWKTYYFKFTNSDSSILPCYVDSIPACSAEEAQQKLQPQNYQPTPISESQFSDPGICSK